MSALAPTIYLPVEIKAREFKAKVLLAGYAARAGFRVYLGTKAAVDNLVARKAGQGGIYFYKGGKPADTLHSIRKKTSAFVVLDEEMGPMVENLEMAYRKRIYPGTEHLIDRLFVIGEAQRDAISLVRPSLLAATRVTGWPRVDLWTPSFSGAAKARALDLKKRFGNFLLFSSNFGVLSDQDVERELIGMQHVQTESDELEHYRTVFTRSVSEFRHVVDLLKAADGDHDMPPIVVRPHPSEDIQIWRGALGKLRKVHVVFEGDISHWLYASSGLLHRGCTTALQAYATGRPSIFIETPGVDINRTSLAYRLSFASTDQLSLRSLAVQAVDGALQAKQIDVSRDVFIDGDEPASSHIVRSLGELDVVKEPGWGGTFAIGLAKRSFGMLSHWVRLALPYGRYRKVVRRKMPGGIHAKEVASILTGLGIVGVSLREVDFNLVEISSQ